MRNELDIMMEILVETLLLTLFAILCIQFDQIWTENKELHLKKIFPCGVKGSVLYLLILISRGAVAWMLRFFYQKTWLFTLQRLCLISVLWPAAVSDHKAYRIPNRLLVIGLIFWAVLTALTAFFLPESLGLMLRSELIATAAITLICLLLMVAVKGGLGMGDMKLMMLMALFLGIEAVCYSMFYSILVAFIEAVFLLVTKRKGRKDHMAFAPCLLIGTLLCSILSGV